MEGNQGSRGLENPPYTELLHSSCAVSNDGTLSAIVSKSVRSLDVPLQSARTAHEDEMLSWLHYPVGDSLDHGYCSNLFGDLPTSSSQLFRHSVTTQFPYSSASIFSGVVAPNRAGRLHRSSDIACMSDNAKAEAMESCGSGPAEASSWAAEVAGADAVVALGGRRGRAAPDFTSSHLGVEVLSKVDSEGEVLSKVREPSLTESSANASIWPLISMHSDSSHNFSHMSGPHQVPFTAAGMASLPLSKPFQHAMDFCSSQVFPGKLTAANFPVFSRPAIETKANLHMLGESSGPTNAERVRHQPGQQGMFQEPSTTPSSRSRSFGDVQGCGVQAGWLPLPSPPPPLHCGGSSGEKSIEAHSKRPPPPPLPAPDAHCAVKEEGDGAVSLGKDTFTISKLSSSAVSSSEKVMETADQTLTSPTQCWVSSTEKSGKATDTSSKRKRVGEDSGYQSEETAVDKKSSSTSKRARTAEAHNQSEKKRRVKINDKLKTLQELIPSGNKPDKASLLDGVIEYIKLLQAQLQVMSLRTGIGIPSWMIPNVNMQHLQMPAFPPMGVGTGANMGMRMGLGLMDVGPGCAILPVPQFTGQPPVGIHTLPAIDRPGMVNPHAFYLAASPLQHAPMKQNLGQSVPMYNPCMPRTPLQPQPQQPPPYLQPQGAAQPQQALLYSLPPQGAAQPQQPPQLPLQPPARPQPPQPVLQRLPPHSQQRTPYPPYQVQHQQQGQPLEAQHQEQQHQQMR